MKLVGFVEMASEVELVVQSSEFSELESSDAESSEVELLQVRGFPPSHLKHKEEGAVPMLALTLSISRQISFTQEFSVHLLDIL